MSTGLIFESFEEAIGVNVINTDNSCTNDVGDPIATTVAKLINYVTDVKAILVNLDEQTDVLSYLNDLNEDIVAKGLMSKAKAKLIDEAHPDFLSTVANIDDFTDIPTKTNVQMAARFLNGKLVDTKDKIVSVFGNDMFKLLMSFITIIKENNIKDVLHNIKESQSFLAIAQVMVAETKTLAVFKDGSLYKVGTFLLNDEYLSMVERSLIDNLDFNKFKVTVDNLKTLVTRWSELELNIDVKSYTYNQLIEHLVQFPAEQYAEQYNGYVEFIQQVINTKKLSDGDVNYKNILVDYVVKEERLSKLDAFMGNLVKVMVVNYILNTVNSINVEYLSSK